MADTTTTPQLVPADAAWDRGIGELPSAHFLQSSTWMHFKARYGWQHHPYRLTAGGDDLGYAGILTRRVLRTFTIAYVPRGPLLRHPDRSSLHRALAQLEPLARRQGWLMLKVDPELWDEDTAWAIPTLKARGWTAGDPVQFRNTVQLPITGTEDELLAAMKPKTRYNIRLAGRRGVMVRPLRPDELGLAYDLYRRTALRDGFIVRPRTYYEGLWQRLVDAGMGTVLAAEYEGNLLAALVAVACGGTCWYFHGASGTEHRNLMPTYLLQWQAIRWGRAQGCTLYDLWGAPESANEPDDDMAGVLRFKLGFGGRFREGLGAWDYAPSPLLYRLYGLASRAVLAAGRAHRHRTQQRD